MDISGFCSNAAAFSDELKAGCLQAEATLHAGRWQAWASGFAGAAALLAGFLALAAGWLSLHGMEEQIHANEQAQRLTELANQTRRAEDRLAYHLSIVEALRLAVDGELQGLISIVNAGSGMSLPIQMPLTPSMMSFIDEFTPSNWDRHRLLHADVVSSLYGMRKLFCFVVDGLERFRVIIASKPISVSTNDPLMLAWVRELHQWSKDFRACEARSEFFKTQDLMSKSKASFEEDLRQLSSARQAQTLTSSTGASSKGWLRQLLLKMKR